VAKNQPKKSPKFIEKENSCQGKSKMSKIKYSHTVKLEEKINK